jgi:hypothetical protein
MLQRQVFVRKNVELPPRQLVDRAYRHVVFELAGMLWNRWIQRRQIDHQSSARNSYASDTPITSDEVAKKRPTFVVGG